MTQLQQANRALIGKDYAAAIALYVRALQQCAPLAPALVGNLHRAQKAYRSQRVEQGAQYAPHVLVSCWDLSHNAAGRAATLAQIWAGIGRAEVIGFLYPPKKSHLWEPLEGFPLPIHALSIVSGQSFVQQVLDFVVAHPCDLLHLSKPRWPNILLGLLYQLVWASSVWMDVDDEELAFVKADSPVDLAEYLQSGGQLPDTTDSFDRALATCLAVGLVNSFDCVTVVNLALQKRYGGSVVYHARDATHFAPSAQRRSRSRAKLGIAPGETVILFAGTPRAHKGILETAHAIAQQRRNDLVYLIVGNFPENLRKLKRKIASMCGLRTIMLPNQNFKNLPDVLAAGDICVLLQDANNDVARYQTPAKLTDALAMGLTVLATPTPALAAFALQGAFIPVFTDQLPQVLKSTLEKMQAQYAVEPMPHPLFKQQLTISANQITLSHLWQKTPKKLNPMLQNVAGSMLELCSLTGLTSK